MATVSALGVEAVEAAPAIGCLPWRLLVRRLLLPAGLVGSPSTGIPSVASEPDDLRRSMTCGAKWTPLYWGGGGIATSVVSDFRPLTLGWSPPVDPVEDAGSLLGRVLLII